MGKVLTPNFRHKHPVLAVVDAENVVLSVHPRSLRWMAEGQLQRAVKARIVEWLGDYPHVGDILRGV